MHILVYTQPNRQGTAYSVPYATISTEASQTSNFDNADYVGTCSAFYDFLYAHQGETLYTEKNVSFQIGTVSSGIGGVSYISWYIGGMNTIRYNYEDYTANVNCASSCICKNSQFLASQSNSWGDIQISNGSAKRYTSASASFYDTFYTTHADSGDKGFRPAGKLTKHTIGGGGTSGADVGYTTGTLTQPGEPDESVASAIKSGFIHAYDISEANLTNVGACLYSETILTAIANLFINPLDGIISLNVFPCHPYAGSSQPIKLLGHQCTTLDLGIDANGSLLSKQFKTVNFGSVNIPEMWSSFLDYTSTSFSLYLPFIGTVDIDINEVMGGNVNVQYTIDFFTGMCVANVLCTKTIPLSDGSSVPQMSQHAYQGNCAIQVPVSSINYGSMIAGLIQAGASAFAGNPVGMIQPVLNGGMSPQVTSKGSISANAGFCSVLYPYITIVRPITSEPESYQDVIGYPSYIDGNLGACEGLCVCDDIDLSSLNNIATAEEMDEIRRICQSGIHV